MTPGQQTTPYGINSVNAPAVWPVTRGKSLANGPADSRGHHRHRHRLQLLRTVGASSRAASTSSRRNGDPLDDNGHGTHVAGIIAAANDGAGVVGVASDVDVYSLKVLDTCGSGKTSDIIQAVQWVVDKKKEIGGNWIINLSLGADEPSAAKQTQFQAAADAGILVFAASGNGYAGTDGPRVSGRLSDRRFGGRRRLDERSRQLLAARRGSESGRAGRERAVDVRVADGGTNDGRKFAAIRADYNDARLHKHGPEVFRVPADDDRHHQHIRELRFRRIRPTSRHRSKARSLSSRAATLTFFDKAQNASKAGAIGIIVYDNAPVDPDNAVRSWLFHDGEDRGRHSGDRTVPRHQSGRRSGAARHAERHDHDEQRLRAVRTARRHFDGFSARRRRRGAGLGVPLRTPPRHNVATALEQTAKDLGDPGKDTTLRLRSRQRV